MGTTKKKKVLPVRRAGRSSKKAKAISPGRKPKKKMVLAGGKLGVVSPAGNKEEVIKTQKGIPEDKLVRVGASVGLTLNLGNYQTARVSCWVELPTKDTPKGIETKFKEAFEIVDKKLSEEVGKIDEERKRRWAEQSGSGETNTNQNTGAIDDMLGLQNGGR